MRRAVLLQRPDAARCPGGDALQVEETAEVLRGGAWDARVVDAVADADALVRPGDTLHLVNVQRAWDWRDLPERAAARGARVFVTPLLHPIATYHQHGRRGLDALLARAFVDPDRFAGLRSGRLGVAARARAVLERADRVLLAAPAEATLLERWCGAVIDGPVVPPAIRRVTASVVRAPFSGDFVLSVGRIEPLKDPLAALRAAQEVGVPVAFVGSMAAGRHLLYRRRFRAAVRAAGPAAARWLGPLPASEVAALQDLARVHVLASWAEVLGRSTVESAARGCAVVLTDVGHAPDLLDRADPRVLVVPPGDAEALRGALAAAWRVGRDPEGPLARRAWARCGWESVAPLLLAAWGPPS